MVLLKDHKSEGKFLGSLNTPPPRYPFIRLRKDDLNRWTASQTNLRVVDVHWFQGAPISSWLDITRMIWQF